MRIKAVIYAQYRPWSKAWEYSISHPGMESAGWLPLEEREIDFEAPPENVLQAGTVAAYRAEQQRIRAEAETKVANLEQTIRDMLCIEDKREGA